MALALSQNRRNVALAGVPALCWISAAISRFFLGPPALIAVMFWVACAATLANLLFIPRAPVLTVISIAVSAAGLYVAGVAPFALTVWLTRGFAP